jgi:hypothetical protein
MWKEYKLVWKEYKVNFHRSLTAPSLAKKLYLRQYNPDELIANIDPTSWADHLIRLCYFGGVQEVLAPALSKGFEYDVNSAYPFCMQKEMPIGNPTLFHNPTEHPIFVVERYSSKYLYTTLMGRL